MTALAYLLGEQVGRPVRDRTGLEGAYQINIEYSRDISLQNGAGQDESGRLFGEESLRERIRLWPRTF